MQDILKYFIVSLECGMSGFPEQIQLYDYTIKVVALGNAAVGKTSCIRRYTEGVFTSNYIATLGTIFSTKIISIVLPNGQKSSVRLILWDLAGQDGYQELRKRYMIGARVAFIAYDITDRESFEAVPEWYSRFIEECPDALVVLVANKVDLDKRVVSTKDGKKLAKKINSLYYEVSAKSGVNINDMFDEPVSKVFASMDLT